SLAPWGSFASLLRLVRLSSNLARRIMHQDRVGGNGGAYVVGVAAGDTAVVDWLHVAVVAAVGDLQPRAGAGAEVVANLDFAGRKPAAGADVEAVAGGDA